MTILKTLLLLSGVLGVPLFVVISGIALVSFHAAGIDLSVVAIEMSRLSGTPMLLSLPLFLFAGNLLAESKAPERLLAVARCFLGWLPGGTAWVALLLCAVFTAFTGASGATIFALGGLLYPALAKDGYSSDFSLGLLTSGGSLGILFPPSLPIILYGVVAGVRIDTLFLAGLVPGMLMLAVLAGYAFLQGKKIPRPSRAGENTPRLLAHAIWELLLPVLLFVGIYGGFFVISEAAAVTALYVIGIETLIYRDLGLRDVVRITVKSSVMFGGIMVVLAASMAATNYLVDQQVPARLFALLQQYVTSKMSFLLLLNLFLLLVGAMLDIFSALVLIVPLIIPLAQGYGVDLVHLGIIFLANLQIGYCTPPVGLSLFLASYRFERPVVELYRATLPFLLLLLATLAAITYLPFLSLWPAG